MGRPRTNRDGKSRCPFVPGQKTIFLSRCPFVLGQGQEQKSRDKLLCPGTSRDKMNFKISKKNNIFSVLEHQCPVLEHPFLFYNVLFCFRTSFSCFRTSFLALSRFVPHPGFWLSRPVPSRILAVLARPVPRQDF